MRNETIKKLLHPALVGRKPEDPDYQIVQLKEFKEVKLAEPIATGFAGIDKFTIGGFRSGDLVIISGQSGRGKTHFSLQMIKHFSDKGNPVMLFSFEEPMDRIKWRMNNMQCDSDILCFAPKKLKSGQVEWLEEKILDSLANHFIEIIVIDNLDFLVANRDSQDDKWTMQSKIISLLKRIAIEYGVIIILNAHIKKVDDSVPKMEDLYGSGDIYKLADFILFIHRLRETSGGRGEQAPFTNKTDVIIEKNRLTGQLNKFHLEMKNNLFMESGGWVDDPSI